MPRSAPNTSPFFTEISNRDAYCFLSAVDSISSGDTRPALCPGLLFISTAHPDGEGRLPDARDLGRVPCSCARQSVTKLP